jgi:hypothetical protein
LWTIWKGGDGDDAGQGQREIEILEELEMPGAIHTRRLDHRFGHLLEIGLHQQDREGRDEFGNDQREQGVEQVELLEHHEKRNEDDLRRDRQCEQDDAGDDLLAGANPPAPAHSRRWPRAAHALPCRRW